ncbi:MAG: deoxyribose-phosphate aldolase [Anaerolineae bacterium]|nr:deoxyribose-phosphate aldolase [Anaerolineae bacterium]
MTVERFSQLFDHSIVRPNAVRADVIEAAETAARLGTASLTVQPHYLSLGLDILRGSGVLLGTVVGFPHGNETPAMKAFQAQAVIDAGAEEIDMVMNIPALKNGEEDLFMHDIEGVVASARGAKVKVILENVYLTEDEKVRACCWIARAGAAFVKTSTAYAEGGATLADVRLMAGAVQGTTCQVKAAGGVRSIEQVLAFLQAGARRFGSTRTAAFVEAYRGLSPAAQAAFAPYLSPASIQLSETNDITG